MKQPVKHLGWHMLVAEAGLADALSAELLHDASQPATWSLDNLGASVTRVRAEGEARFFFSPRAAAVFEATIARFGGKPCGPPLARAFAPAHSSRLLLGFKSHWEPFRPPRLAPSHARSESQANAPLRDAGPGGDDGFPPAPGIRTGVSR